MNNIQNLEASLEKAKKEEKLNYLKEELGGLVKEYQGKCFGSHTFERSNKSKYQGATYYEKFYIEKDEIYVLEWNISLSKYPSFYKKSKNTIFYNRTHHERKLTGDNKYNANYNLYSGYSFFRKEISLKKFMQLWEIGEEADIIINTSFNNAISKMEYITIGDNAKENSIEECIISMDLDIIDLKNHPQLQRVLEYRYLPMFQESRWLLKIYAKKILEWQISKLKIDMQSVFATARRNDHLQNEIDIIQKFINSQL